MGAVVDKQALFLDHYHRTHTNKLISFAAWEVPAYFTSILDEHFCVRQRVGLFDISHMGDVLVRGRQANQYLQHLLTNDLTRYSPGRAFYSVMCRANGCVVDDVFVYPLKQEESFLIINAANIQKDLAFMQEQAEGFDVVIENRSDHRGLIALQGPKSDEVASAFFRFDSRQISFHEFKFVPWQGSTLGISATGYTGERGFEIMYEKPLAEVIWTQLLDAGKPFGIQAIGFGARDTLRLEAGCALYGHEIDETITPLEAKLGWIVRLQKKEDFVGKAALLRQKQEGLSRSLFGLLMTERGAIPRQGCQVYFQGEVVGSVCSGSFLPSLEKNGATALLQCRPELVEGQQVFVDIRSRHYPAMITTMPFYRRQNK